MDETTTGRTIDLPASRAFVVQLAASVGADTPFRGRIEHLASGSATHFESLPQLGAFVVAVLAPGSTPKPGRWAARTGFTASASRRTATKREESIMKRIRNGRNQSTVSMPDVAARVLIAALGFGWGTLVAGHSAMAQVQSTAQQVCINGVSSSAEKVGQQQVKENLACLRSAGRGTLAGSA